ncbi:hypothetical protein LOAG_18973 [Loa loa]|uniref:Uncharacterized protein n=1 Tax=Loa loa TaxID=7209 RepID=A0A1S0UDV2_LOALO|nr:hypothetical protein LOAG_18973 [Loa loa]EJD73611.1 hypothetical protein LOAG_18973 [Loa loa]
MPTAPTSYLPQLSIPIFNGDPRLRREFWSSFNAAVHSQTIHKNIAHCLQFSIDLKISVENPSHLIFSYRALYKSVRKALVHTVRVILLHLRVGILT